MAAELDLDEPGTWEDREFELTSEVTPIAVPEPAREFRKRDSLVAMQKLVDADELTVVFQPIINMRTGRAFAYEALVRCSAPGLESPTALFERAVSFGCVGRLGRMIREIGMPLMTGLPLFVNVHPLELQEGWLVRPDDPIYLHDHDVFVEVTESVPLSHYELCLSVLKEMRARSGIHLVVDDLGAGYSNLKRIADLEPHVVKLDRGLIMGIERSRRQQQLVSSVVRLCTELGAKVVAEGIETNEEFLAIADTGAHFGQGYLFAKPAFPLPEVTWPPGPPDSVKDIRRSQGGRGR
ncbi:MAG TPA: EAL domain-containing protein [Polyangiaceae bacterium]|nr:EAL domain-containing protein [Polyangiaceae bacterium]